MNHSIHSADRATHLKIVVVALVAGIAVAGFGISARTNSDYTQTAHVIKAGKPVLVKIADIERRDFRAAESNLQSDRKNGAVAKTGQRVGWRCIENFPRL